MIINRIRVYLFTLKLCWFSIFKINLGDEVLYEDKVWIVSNGVTRPIWDLRRENGEHALIHQSKFVKIKSVKNVIHDVSFTWNFYSGYWFSIWFKEPSKMRGY